MSFVVSLLGLHCTQHLPSNPWFLRVCCTSQLKTLRVKENLLVTSNFSFPHSVFYPFREFSDLSIKFEIVVCKLHQFGSLKFDVWERVNDLDKNKSHIGLLKILWENEIICLGF